MKPASHPTALRTARLLRDAGIDARVVEFERPTRTSAEAAAAIGCSVAEIAKSIVFRGQESGQAVVVVASGDNRVSEAKVAAQVHEPLARGVPRHRDVRGVVQLLAHRAAPVGTQTSMRVDE